MLSGVKHCHLQHSSEWLHGPERLMDKDLIPAWGASGVTQTSVNGDAPGRCYPVHTVVPEILVEKVNGSTFGARGPGGC